MKAACTGCSIAAFGGQSLDRGDLAALDLGGERQTGEHALAVDMAGAGAALALVAALLGAGQRQMLTQRVPEQCDARLDIELVSLAR